MNAKTKRNEVSGLISISSKGKHDLKLERYKIKSCFESNDKLTFKAAFTII